MNSVNLIANLIIICIGLLVIWYLVGKVVDELMTKTNHDPVVQGNKVALGDPITVGDELDGATLCDWCGNHFKSDGNLERCNECVS